ncbi:GNAT family N-acetyltransferase [Phormidium sp. LEGE 05292]|uniref:GNAT family N-acetyltransferase n=1 Tax=[Phormidium] sp. LEGE 05292 TaxID=767427 RepID=UPI001882A2ED|nr:GNAT family N-acetyltransferase [Phormidium sp. LEGE 05292]MBE9228382.1 GNAT family N-acetyltransferase [Phormidium sp. LEGE 05292]
MGIKPLSHETLEQAISLVDRIFPYQKDAMYENARIVFSASLEKNNSSYKPLLEQMQITEANYWVAIDENSSKVVGITGLYGYAEDESEAYWLGYTCVDPDFRGQGIGAKLVDFVIEKARSAGKKFLRLYTSNFQNQAIAQILYEKRGLQIIGEEQMPGSEFKKIYRELKL